MTIEQSPKEEIEDLGSVLLEIGSHLMSSGANSLRVRDIIERIATSLGYRTNLLITHRALMITLHDEKEQHFFSSLKRTSPHGANFRISSGISRMSWRVADEGWTIEQIKQELDRLIHLPHYPRIVILLMISLAGASFCRLFGGNAIDMLVTAFSTFGGLFVRQEMTKRHFNPYLVIFCAAFTASLISGAYLKFSNISTSEHAFAASVLFLIPGIPLINSLSDIIDGNIMNGIVRGVNGLVIAFTIALGLLTAMLIYQL
jgi:uncharacterized membrane protein YjjP (DUF1212 family)